jgi:molybdopterin-guanine dinucleotide biosynthesis protein A
MTADFLETLLALCQDDQGAVPRGANGFEPLAAVYPVSCGSLATAALRRGDFSMQRFVREGTGAQLLVEREISETEVPLFTNLNTPADL